MNTTSSQATILTLEDMTIYESITLRNIFLQALAEYEQIEVNLSNVTEIDCAGLQLMIAFKNAATEQGKTLQFTAHSHKVITFLDLLNMNQFFGDPVLLEQSNVSIS